MPITPPMGYMSASRDDVVFLQLLELLQEHRTAVHRHLVVACPAQLVHIAEPVLVLAEDPVPKIPGGNLFVGVGHQAVLLHNLIPGVFLHKATSSGYDHQAPLFAVTDQTQ